jgi:hypothetical protein
MCELVPFFNYYDMITRGGVGLQCHAGGEDVVIQLRQLRQVLERPVVPFEKKRLPIRWRLMHKLQPCDILDQTCWMRHFG